MSLSKYNDSKRFRKLLSDGIVLTKVALFWSYNDGPYYLTEASINLLTPVVPLNQLSYPEARNKVSLQRCNYNTTIFKHFLIHLRTEHGYIHLDISLKGITNIY